MTSPLDPHLSIDNLLACEQLGHCKVNRPIRIILIEENIWVKVPNCVYKQKKKI